MSTSKYLVHRQTVRLIVTFIFRRVPRIFIGGEFFGGCDEICAAKKDGVLEHKLNVIGAI